MKTSILFWVTRLVAAFIMLQTLYFKFTGSAESVYIFSAVGMEPWGRWLVGVLELVASILLFIPATVWLGAALAISLMVGALVLHIIFLGIEVQGDGGQLFIYALTVFLCSCYIFWVSRKTIPQQIQKWYSVLK